jgi:MFS family permease
MRRILFILVVSQFCCTSVWFAGNAVIGNIAAAIHQDPGFLAHLTSAIQFGFISGTLVFAVFTIADRFSPSMVFFASAMLASLFNLGLVLTGSGDVGLLIFRFLTGFFLAGIYPVGMKIAADHFAEKLGKSLGFLVGALVIGTALPHLLKNFSNGIPWKYVVYVTSVLCICGGLAVLLFVPDGPHRRKGQQFNFLAFINGFRVPAFRVASFGYFGHMWELYSFWAFLPLMLKAYDLHYPNADLNIPLLSFLIIGSGSVACVMAGFASQRYGAKNIATLSLLLSFLCCLASPFLLFFYSKVVFIGFLFFWGLVVIADSPLFSSLVATNAPPESKGSSLTIVNCIGFSITIISIEFINFIGGKINPEWMYLFLAAGPLLGLVALFQAQKR